jgi:hypothetical protein
MTNYDGRVDRAHEELDLPTESSDSRQTRFSSGRYTDTTLCRASRHPKRANYDTDTT